MKKTIELRHKLHKCAELSGCEAKTRLTLMEAIQSDTDLEVCDRGSWFYAYYDCGSPDAKTIGVRADMDALPMTDMDVAPVKDPAGGIDYSSDTEGVSHRCGHDGHSAALYALANLISERGASNNVYLIFQHAEETGQGGAECAQLIDEKNIDEIYAFHNWSGFDECSIVLGEGTVMCASEGLRIIMEGRPAHASQPEDGINPGFALAQVAGRVAELEERYSGRAMATMVGINAGGRNFGMAPGEGELDLTLRALREEDMIALEKEILAFAEEVADEAGLKLSTEKQDMFPDTTNDPGAVAKVREAAESLDFAVSELEEPIRSSEDFGWYQKKCPGAMIFIGNGRDWPQIHTSTYDFNDRILETAAELMYELVK
ncbi:MAG: M20 family metallopeptidase [Bacillota bacterium]|nr:M20 family metallopeptidase [Bacillota bacterium]